MEWTDQQIAGAQAELLRWHGLPHLDRRAEPGKGIDCIHLVMQALYGAEILEPRRMPAYRPRWGLVSPENIMAEGLSRVLFAARLRRGQAQYGDIIIWRSGRQSNHCGFTGHDQAGQLSCWHIMKGGVVHSTPLRPILQRAQELVRIVKPGWKAEPATIKLEDLGHERK